MDPKYWSKPVTLETGVLGKYKTITSTGEAARMLLNQWPVEKGRRYSRARKTCLAVLDGTKPPSEARKAFIDAADEADLFVREQ